MQTKDQMIEMLIEDDLSDWFNEVEKNRYFAQLLHDGFTGYRNQTHEELLSKCVERALIEFESNYPDCKQCGIDNYICFMCEQEQKERLYERA